MTKREQGLLIVAFLFATIMSYWLFRYRPLAAGIATRQQQAGQASEKRKEFKLPDEPVESPAALRRQLAELRSSLDAEQLWLTELKRGFVPLDRPGSVQELKVQLSDLANKCGIRIEESLPYERKSRTSTPSETEPGRPSADFSAMLASTYQRPLYQMKAECRFRELICFIRGLNQLPRRVVVVKLDVKTVAGVSADDGIPMLEAELVLAL